MQYKPGVRLGPAQSQNRSKPQINLKVRDRSVMANEESSHASWEDEELTPFVRSMEKIINNENLEAMVAPNLPKEKKHIMDKVPDVLREQNENAYRPTTVSIGPLHRGTPRLEAMEHVKSKYTRSLLGRTCTTFEETMRDCAAAMLKVEEDVRKCYEPSRLPLQPPPNTQENVSWRLAEVMLLDGCFVIEVLYRNYEKEYDAILLNPFNFYAIERDLLLLENQIPFFVLQQLFKLTVEKISTKGVQRPSLTKLVLLFFRGIMGFENSEIIGNMETTDPYHILHLLHSHYLPPQSSMDRRKYDEMEEMENRINYCATELLLGGVELKAAGKKRNLFDIKFTTSFSCSSCWFMFRKGHIEIPPFIISDSTESFLRNLIAFELSCPWINSYFTSFAFLIDLLIDTAEDVNLLEEAGIIYNDLGSEKQVARLFNGICDNAVTHDFLYSEQYKAAMDFCNHPWQVSTRKLRHDYFGNPWTGISVIAAIFLFVLTFISTLYTLLSYYY